MIPTNNNFEKNELFDSIAEPTMEIYLWEILQAWMIFLSQRDLSPQDISNRLFFFELLDVHLQKGRSDFDKNRQEKIALSGNLNPTSMNIDSNRIAENKEA